MNVPRRDLTSAQRRRRGSLWAAALAVVVAIVLVAVVVIRGDDTGTAGQAGSPVERFMHVHGLAIAPWAPDDVYLSTHRGLIRIGADGGWRYVSDEPHDFMGFAVHPRTEDVMFTSGHPSLTSGLDNPLGFMVSSDAGRTWQVRSLHGEVDFHAMDVHHGDGEVIYGFDVTGGRLLRSSDAGRTWAARTLPHPHGVFALAVHPVDADVVLAGSAAGLHVSTDGGDTWETVIADDPVTAVTYWPAAADRIVAYVDVPARGLLESTDGGRTWEPVGLVLDGDAAGHIAVHPTDVDVVYVGTHREALHRTTDGGDTWERLAEGGVPRTDTP